MYNNFSSIIGRVLPLQIRIHVRSSLQWSSDQTSQLVARRVLLGYLENEVLSINQVKQDALEFWPGLSVWMPVCTGMCNEYILKVISECQGTMMGVHV